MRFKLSRKAYTVLLVGVFMVIAGGLGVAYGEQSNRQDKLNSELLLAQLRLDTYESNGFDTQLQTLEDQKLQIEADIDSFVVSLTQSIDDVNVIEALFVKLANVSDIEIIEIKSSSVIEQVLDSMDFIALPLVVTIRGNLADIIDFIKSTGQQFPTSVIESVRISMTEAGEEYEQGSAVISLLVLSYIDYENS